MFLLYCLFVSVLIRNSVYSPVVGGVDAKELFKSHIISWIRNKRCSLLDRCKLDKVYIYLQHGASVHDQSFIHVFFLIGSVLEYNQMHRVSWFLMLTILDPKFNFLFSFFVVEIYWKLISFRKTGLILKHKMKQLLLFMIFTTS